MYKIIGGDHKEYGPVRPDDLRRWIAESRLNAQSLVRAAGGTEWKPLAELPEFAEALGAKATTAQVPPPALPTPGTATSAAEIVARPTQLRIGFCLSRAWTLFESNFGLLFGACALYWLLGLICQLIPFV